MSGAATARWGDLRHRVLSALVLVGVAVGAVLAGQTAIIVLAIVVVSLMLWELARLSGQPGSLPPLLLAGLVPLIALALIGAERAGLVNSWMNSLPAALLVVPLLMLPGPRRDRWASALYALAVIFAGVVFVELAEDRLALLLWVVGVVIASDVLGYFAGRTLGGPKFWPAVSPRKTWSGTVAGWLGAMGLGLIYWRMGGSAAALVAFPVLAFAGQMGDIAESAMKRRAGIKDSSALIPGHGGFLDRFDALIFALVALAPFAGLLAPGA